MSQLKHKICYEYKLLVKALSIGHLYDYSHILDMINFIEILEYLPNRDFIERHLLQR